MFCGNCGSSVDEGSAFCSGCGNKVEIKEPMKQTHTNAVAENNSRRQTEPQKNAAFGMKTIVITALAVVVLAGCGFFAWHVRESKKSEAAEAARLVAEQLQAEEDARFAAEQAQAEAAEQAIAEAEKALAAAKQQAQQAKTAEARAKAEAEQARLAEQASIAAAEARRMELEREARRQELEDRRRKAQSSAKQTVPQKPATPQKPAAPQVTQVTLAAGTPVRVITSSEISTQTSDTGYGFTVILNEDLGYGGQIIARRRAAVRGVVSESDPGGRVKGVATISVTLSGITLADGSLSFLRISGRPGKTKNCCRS